jgi:hypothetical protein
VLANKTERFVSNTARPRTKLQKVNIWKYGDHCSNGDEKVLIGEHSRYDCAQEL